MFIFVILRVEGTHYLRREEEPPPLPQPAKRYVDCLLCTRSDSTALGNKRKSNICVKGYRLDRLMAHYQSVHKDAPIDEGSRTLLDTGFTRREPDATGSNAAATAGQDLIRSNHSAHIWEWTSHHTGSYPWNPSFCCYR